MNQHALPSAPSSFTPPPDLAPGSVIGKYRIERVIGEGAMGLVVEATNLDLDERVALKFMRDAHHAGPAAMERFAREARAAAKLKSEHVARVFDVGSFEGVPFIVMELLIGKDLEALLHKGGPLPVPTAVLYVIQACEALAEAHARGIVHRDVKPANVFIADRPGRYQAAKLLDFGVSKIVSGGFSDRASVRDTGGLVGSPYYMAPEQFRPNCPAKATSDVWGLGLVLFESLTGKAPFDETHGLAALMTAIAIEPHARITALRPEVPADLERVVDWCLEKDPARRCPSVAELALALLPFAPESARLSVERALAMSGRPARLSEPPPSSSVRSVPPPPVTLDREPVASPAGAPALAPPSLFRGAAGAALGVIALTCLGLWVERSRTTAAEGERAAIGVVENEPAVASPPPALSDMEANVEPEPAADQTPASASPLAAPPPSAGAAPKIARRGDVVRKSRASSGPPPAIAAAVAAEARDHKALNAAVRARAPEVQACLENARPHASVESLRGKVAVLITLDGTGAVTQTALATSTVGSRALEACLLGAVRSWQLPAPAGKTRDHVSRVTYSFVFR